jgi:putative phosphoesterase
VVSLHLGEPRVDGREVPELVDIRSQRGVDSCRQAARPGNGPDLAEGRALCGEVLAAHGPRLVAVEDDEINKLLRIDLRSEESPQLSICFRRAARGPAQSQKGTLDADAVDHDRQTLSASCGHPGHTSKVLVALLTDTHGPRRWRQCPPEVARHLRDVDLILHAGDACTAAVLDELATYAPVRAVIGNNDGPDVAEWGASPQLEIELDGVPVAMVHDSGAANGRAARLRRSFPDARVVIFGHSHIPWDHDENGQRAINPGSPTDRRRQPHGTMGLLRLEAGAVVSADLIRVTP